MTNVLISADMEGITGVTCPDDVRPGSAGWAHFRELMASDVNAAIEGLFAAGATSVLVNDAHDKKRNLPLALLDERAELITGTHKRLGMMEGIQYGMDAVAFIGYHTSAGMQGILSHTYIGTGIIDVRINGVRAGEGRMNALLAAEYGAPLVLVTGDDLTCGDSAGWTQGIGSDGFQKVAVKTCVDRYTARCLPPARTRELIRAAAQQCLSALPAAESPTGPFTYEVDFDAAHFVIATTAIPGVEQTGDRTVSFTFPTMHEAIRCFKVVTSMSVAAMEPDYG